jgi:transcriptional regulator with XRE-family HTH domain
MLSCANLIGPNVVKFRHRRGWSQKQTVIKLQLKGLYITRDILVNIELRRSVVTDVQIKALAEVFGITILDLFPSTQMAPQTMWQVDQLTDRSRRRS